MALQHRAGKQTLVHGEQVLDRDPRSPAERLDRPLHHLDVVDHLGSRDVRRTVSDVARELRLEQPAPADLQAFDA